MLTARRDAHAPWHLLLALLASSCGGPSEPVRACSADDECGPGARCVQSACVANRPPVAALHLPAALTTHRLVSLQASAADPDAGDTISRFTWTVTPAGAGCEAEREPGSGSSLDLVFWCAGSYEVTVVAEDGRGGTSAPASQAVEVTAATGAPVVTAGPELQVEHACGGTPFACRPALAGSPVALPLSATAVDPAGGALTLRWRMLPPAGADARATVLYASGETSLDTEAWLETPGGMLAGTWRFRLRATSAAGLLGQADQLVQVGNRPPLLAPSPLRLEHRHEGGAFRAGGALPLPASDPDGDPVSLSATLEETGAAGCASALGPVTGGVVGYDTRCNEPTQLLGAASRVIRIVASDGNGGTAEAAVPVEIGNRPPQLRLASNPAGGTLTLDHTVAPCPIGGGSCFIATGTASFEVVDPDGDPVTGPAVAAALPSDLPASTGQASTAGGVTTFLFATTLDSPAAFRSASGATRFSLAATAADPFGASASLVVPVVIGNRPPVLRRASASAVVPHRYDWARHAWVATAPLAAFEDPDGDPLSAEGSAGDPACRAFSFTGGDGRVDCSSAWAPASGPPPLASLVGAHAVELRAFDGWEGATSATAVDVQNGAPTATPFDGVVESCFCDCSKWNADGSACVGQWRWVTDASSVPLPVQAGDPDGDPVQVTYSPAVASGPQKTVAPTACGDTLVNPSFPVTVQVTIDDGLGRVQTTSRVTGVACATAGQACTP